MRLWRIAAAYYALDRTGFGAMRDGGRWNPPGRPALYCATSVALCSLEKFVHLGALPVPPLSLVAIDLPDDLALYRPDRADLPQGWDATRARPASQRFGGAWLAGASTVGMVIPSAIVHEEFNVVLNPLHPDCARVGLAVVRDFAFDERMFVDRGASP